MTAPCPSEDVLAVHADGELQAAEARAILSHLSGCARCRSLLAALRGESRLLSRVLDEADGPAPAPRAVFADVATVGLCLLGAAAGLEFLFGWVGDLGRQSPVDVDASSFVVSVAGRPADSQ